LGGQRLKIGGSEARVSFDKFGLTTVEADITEEDIETEDIETEDIETEDAYKAAQVHGC